MNEIKNEKQLTWDDIELVLATEIVEESKKKSRRWFSAWLLTAALLILTNIFWYIAYSL